MVGNYSIVNWLFDDNRMTTPYNKSLDVSEELQRLAASERASGDGRLTVFLNRVDVFSNENSLGVFDINQVIFDNNEDWKGRLIRDIDASQTEDDLGIIRDRLNSERNNFEDNSSEDIDRALTERASQLTVDQAVDREGERREAEIEDIENIINNAETSDDIVVPTIGSIRRQYGNRVASRISGLLADKLDTFESLADRDLRVIGRQISSATTTEELDRINLDDTSTFAVEDELSRQIEDRRGQLE